MGRRVWRRCNRFRRQTEMETQGTATDAEAMMAESSVIVKTCSDALTGHPADVQGMALAELVAMFVAAHAPPLRQTVGRLLLRTTARLVSVAEDQIFGPGGHPYRAFMRAAERGGEPCGECYLQPDETCDICGPTQTG